MDHLNDVILGTDKTAWWKHLLRDETCRRLTSDGYILVQTPVHILKTGLCVGSYQY